MINIKKKYIVAVKFKEKCMPVVYYFKAKNDQEVKRRMYEEFKDVLDQIEGIDYDQVKFTKHNRLLCGNCTSAGRLKEMFEKKYIIRDEAKEMVEELFNKKVNNSNNKENKEMTEIKPMTTVEDIIDMLYEDLKKRDQNPEKEETKANVENLYEKWRNINTKYGGLFKDADEVEAIYINADKKVIVLKWIDGETTKAVCGPQDKFDIEAGVFLALAKRYCDYETIVDCCDWEGITPDMEKGVFFNLAQDFFDIFEIKRYVNWAKKVYAKQTKKEVKKTSLDNPGEKPTNPNLGVKIKKYRG